MLKLRSAVIIGAAALGLTAIGGPAQAAPDATITITQVGNTIVATGSGFIDLAGLTPFSLGGSFPFNGEIFPSIGVAVVGMGTASTAIDQYSGASGPATLGPGLNDVLGTIGSGDLFGIDASGHIGAGPVVVVPAGYVSGASLSGSATFDATFASLGLTPGIYTYVWSAPVIPGVASSDGNLVIDVVSPGGVPETGTWVMMLIGFAGFGYAGYRGRRSAVAAAL